MQDFTDLLKQQCYNTSLPVDIQDIQLIPGNIRTELEVQSIWAAQFVEHQICKKIIKRLEVCIQYTNYPLFKILQNELTV